MNYVLGFLLIAFALLLFIMVGNNSWVGIWEAFKSAETPQPSADTNAPQGAPTGGPF